MLVVDDNMLRLAKMQETLLKVSNVNKTENLNKYKEIVLQIDAKAFSDILEDIKHIDEHNHSLEEELQFLEKIKSEYNQLLELQLGFKKVCSLYGENDLKLSDLSQLNIEYIENRINSINGYLMNLKNIEANKRKLEELNEQLVEEEKKKTFLNRKLSELENALRENFLSAEGRCLVDGKLEPTTIISEYKKLELEFEELLKNFNSLDKVLSQAEAESSELTEKFKTAEICYNSILTTESKQILEDIRRESLKVKYKLTMLKILKILSQNYEDYDNVKKKREDILDLIKYRLTCLESLGTRISIDPFSRTKVKEQLDTIMSLNDNSTLITKIRKDIGQLNSRTEEMLKENNVYLLSLSDTRSLIERKVSMNDIDITGIELSYPEPVIKKVVAGNQVVEVKIIPSTLNMSIIGQKTSTVIKRVNQMMNGKTRKQESFIPELVIISNPSIEIEEPTDLNQKNQTEFIVPEFVPDAMITQEKSQPEAVEDKKIDETILFEEIQKTNSVPFDINDNLFENVTPFSEPAIFLEKADEELALETPDIVFPIYQLEDDSHYTETQSTKVEEMPDAFWITQEDDKEDLVEDSPLSFDDQIDILLSTESNNNKTRKKVA